MAVLVFTIFLLSVSVFAADTEGVEEGGSSLDIQVTALPGNYRMAVSRELKGKFIDVSYPVNHYINPSRQLVASEPIDKDEAGREVVSGKTITKKFNIYLPPGYDQNDSDVKYNVLYLLHGVGGNRYEWPYGSGQVGGNFVICNIFDNLIANGEIEPLIVVFPEGRSSHDWEDTAFTSEKTNVLGFYYFDYELRYDLIPYIESNYNTYANIADTSEEGIAYNRNHRAIAGLSMGGMQALNLVFEGYRYDSERFTKGAGGLGNGLAPTIPTPGMQDLFAYVGAFSNAPTSSDGRTLGKGIGSSDYKTDLLYITCGDADGIAMRSYLSAVNGLKEAAGDNLDSYYKIVMRGKGHDFNVWNNGAYNFARLIFRDDYQAKTVEVTLN